MFKYFIPFERRLYRLRRNAIKLIHTQDDN